MRLYNLLLLQLSFLLVTGCSLDHMHMVESVFLRPQPRNLFSRSGVLPPTATVITSYTPSIDNADFKTPSAVTHADVGIARKYAVGKPRTVCDSGISLDAALCPDSESTASYRSLQYKHVDSTVRRFQSQGVNNTVVRIYPPGISAPLERQVQVSDNLIRAMSSNTSEELGTQRDIRVLGFLADHVLRAQATGVLDFNSTLYDGTLSFSGILTAGLLPPVDELTITGGTGVFRGASGHVISTALSYDIDSGIQKISLCRKLCHYD